MSELIDQLERDRFVSTHDKNISVIAPAGVGKTRAIVQRIVAVAQQPEDIAVDRLARLIVVTYSVRAAQEMQQRARTALRDTKGISPRVQRAFLQTFFGTIHSYCVRLLDRFGHYLGLPSPVGLLQDHDEWWNRFLLRGVGPVKGEFAELFHFFPPEKLYALGKEVSPGEVDAVAPAPILQLQPILAYPLNGLHASTKKSLAAAQERVLRWSDAWARGDRYHPLPSCPQTKQDDFVELWTASFAPLHDWLGRGALAFGREVANAYENFRRAEAVMTYDDQVRLALRLLDEPQVRTELTEESLSVLLDEAQDTDPRQFEVLLRLAGLGPGGTQGHDQSFCIVGDFQQVIYAPRSDLSVYRDVRDKLVVGPRGASSRLKVTFRCDKAIIHFVNEIFPDILHGANGQSEFFDLTAREDAGPGQVARWRCPDEPDRAAGKTVKAAARAKHEARFLARELKNLTPVALGASSWSQVAILCPRKNWLRQIERELRDAGVPVQFHSSDETPGDRCATAWLAALVWIAAHPEDAFEIAGVLREIFGVSDHDMAEYTGGHGDRLRLDRPSQKLGGSVEEALQILREARADDLPLHRQVARLVEATRLRERLLSIEEFELEDTAHDLDETLAAVFRRSAEGATLAELAYELRIGLGQASPGEEDVQDAIQLLTSHKAKGLEWQTVILPYLFREIETKTRPYPRLVHGDGGREMIFRGKSDYDTHAKAFVQERDRQQLQRLLYVMCTRAKHTLLLIDDETLFDGQRRRGGWSSGELLHFLGGVNRVRWQALPEKLVPIDLPKPEKIIVAKRPLDFEALAAKDVEAAVGHAKDIPTRITPHTLAALSRDEGEPEAQREREDDQPAPDNPGILYGTWWHEFVQTLPWDEPEDWPRRFADALTRSPQPERAQQEWQLFCDSELAHWLAQPGRVIHRELPFLWLEKENACFEGIMDLAIYTPADSAWRVIDWKTNRRVDAALVEKYRGQIDAYVRALRDMLAVEVRGSLYFTATGEWIETPWA